MITRSILRQVVHWGIISGAWSRKESEIRSLIRRYTQSPGPASQRALVSAVTDKSDPAAVRIFCDEVLLNGDDKLVSLVRARGIAPEEPESRLLFHYATGQITAFSPLNKMEEQRLLITAYNQATEYMQQAVRNAASRWHTETLLADALLLGSGEPDCIRRLSFSEWEIIVSGLISASRHEELYRFLPHVPIPHVIHAVRCLQKDGWSPSGMTGELWGDMIRVLPEKWSYPDRSPSQRSVLEKPDTRTHNLVFSPDGSLIVTGGYDGTIRIWEVKRGELLFSSTGCNPLARTPFFSPDGKFLIVPQITGDVTVLAIPSGAVLYTVGVPNGGCCPVAVSPDSRLLAYSANGQILLKELNGGENLFWFTEVTAPVTALSFSPEGEFLAAGFFDGTIRVWSLIERSLQWACPAGSGRIISLSYSDEGTGIIAIPFTGHAFRIDATTGHRSFSFGAEIPAGLTWFFTADCKYLAVNGGNDTVHIWKTSDGSCVTTISVNQKGGATCLAVVPDDLLIITGGSGGILRIFSYNTSSPDQMFTGHKDHVSALAVSPDGKLLASAGQDGTTKVFSLPSGQLIRPIPVNARGLTSLCVSHDATVIAAADDDGRVRLWQLPENRLIRTIDAFTTRITAIALGQDGALLACAGTDGTVRLWSTVDNSMVGALTGITGSTRALAFTPDGSGLISGGWDGLLRYWSVPKCERVVTLTGHTGVITSIACSPDGTRFASGGSDGLVRIWDTEKGLLLASCTADSKGVECVAITPDGNLVVAGCRDASIRLLRIRDGSPVADISGAPATVTGLAVVPGRDLLAASAADGSISYFSISQRSHVRNFSAHCGGVISAIGCGKHGFFASCGHDGTVRLWNLPESGPVAGRDPEIMQCIAREVHDNPYRKNRLQYEFLYAFLALCFAYEICLLSPPVSIGEYDIGIVG